MKILAGNPGKRPLSPDEPNPEPSVPTCPPHLNDEAQAEWGRITVELHELGLLTRCDRAALAAYCVVWARWVRAEEKVNLLGEMLVAKETKQLYQNPYVFVANKALQLMHRYLVEFGLSPCSRARVGGASVKKPAAGVMSRKRHA